MRCPVLTAAVLSLALSLAPSAPVWAFAPEEGMASWYGGKFQGRRTASGEIFDTNQLTAAHKTLPFGTLVLVTSLDNGKTVVVRINDRGPFVAGRIIDLSRAAAESIGMTGRGVARVRIQPPRAGRPEPPPTFQIQLGAFRTRARADGLLGRLSAAGFAATVREGEGGIYRVAIAAVAESDLEDTRRRLRDSGFTDQLVRREAAPAAGP